MASTVFCSEIKVEEESFISQIKTEVPSDADDELDVPGAGAQAQLAPQTQSASCLIKIKPSGAAGAAIMDMDEDASQDPDIFDDRFCVCQYKCVCNKNGCRCVYECFQKPTCTPCMQNECSRYHKGSSKERVLEVSHHRIWFRRAGSKRTDSALCNSTINGRAYDIVTEHSLMAQHPKSLICKQYPACGPRRLDCQGCLAHFKGRFPILQLMNHVKNSHKRESEELIFEIVQKYQFHIRAMQRMLRVDMLYIYRNFIPCTC